MPLDLLKQKQDAIATELGRIAARLSEIEADFAKAEANLERALAFAGNCEAAYRAASPTVRRQFNQALFEQLLIDEDYDVQGELAEPFQRLLSDPLRRAAIEHADDELRQAIERALGEREGPRPEKAERPPTELVGAGQPTTSCKVVGWSQEAMVELVGLEPTTSRLPAGRSPN